MEDTILAESNGLKEMEDDNLKIESPKEVKQPKKRVRKQPSERIAETEKNTKEPVIPRPSLVRKSVERSVELETIRKFRVDKGRGTALKDIPNVANQLKKQKADETFKLLHFILFGRHMKAFKSNLSEFSGFAGHENEEKHRSKIKEILDKYGIEKLLEFCDVLDIHVSKRTRTRKEEIVAELLNFLVAPHVTTDVVPAEKEQQLSFEEEEEEEIQTKFTVAYNKRIRIDDEVKFFEDFLLPFQVCYRNNNFIEKIDSACEQSILVPKDKGLSLSELKKAKIEKLRLERKEQEIEIEKLKLEKTEQQIENERLRKKLRDKDEALEQSQELNNVLILKEHQQNNELQQIRKLLIRGIGECSSQHSVVQLREMGEIDRKPFLEALKDKCNSSSEEQVSSRSAKLCSFWEEMLKDQIWHPFKVTLVDGKQKELVDEGDRLLKGLKNEWGEKVYDAVANALVELNEYNPNGRNSVQELWNLKEKRKATLIEGVSYVLNCLKKHPITTTTTAATSTPRK